MNSVFYTFGIVAIVSSVLYGLVLIAGRKTNGCSSPQRRASFFALQRPSSAGEHIVERLRPAALALLWVRNISFVMLVVLGLVEPLFR
jgi:hypothetical protein